MKGQHEAFTDALSAAMEKEQPQTMDEIDALINRLRAEFFPYSPELAAKLSEIPDTVKSHIGHGKHELLYESLSKGEWDRALALADSQNRLALFRDLVDTDYFSLHDKGIQNLLIHTISGSDAPHRVYDFLCDALQTYHENDILAFDGDEARKAFQQLPETIEIFRGTNDTESEYGICWTLDRDKAIWFATEHGRFRVQDQQPVLLTASVNRFEIFGFAFDRGESEVIIWPGILQTVAKEIL